ncbi:hypothetical protein EW146_g10005 [Bondarzewia mesenterica]|uniref:Uncharacterized protein n=1 Tax=Bondarzewia mesenterica TaxID=1095465 RepID=A0A4S4L648_9AGAM|nr:hypothetical protein EW146_g10005 [Bondarzewia mesenterica]
MRISNTAGCGVAGPAALIGPYDSSGFPVGCKSACEAGLAADPSTYAHYSNRTTLPTAAPAYITLRRHARPPASSITLTSREIAPTLTHLLTTSPAALPSGLVLRQAMRTTLLRSALKDGGFFINVRRFRDIWRLNSSEFSMIFTIVVVECVMLCHVAAGDPGSLRYAT